MSDKVDIFIEQLEKGWGAKPKPGNVSPGKEPGGEAIIEPVEKGKMGIFMSHGHVVKATQEGCGMTYGAVFGGKSPPVSKYNLEHMNKALDAAEETEMQVSEQTKPVKILAKVPKGTFDVSKMLTEAPVPMLGATKLYQPVRGTSAGSRYFIIAISPALSVSARWRTNENVHGLALRVEGKGIDNPDTVKMLTEIGLDAKSPHHMSAHLTVETEIEVRKAIGALLMGINEPWKTPTPDPGRICV